MPQDPVLAAPQTPSRGRARSTPKARPAARRPSPARLAELLAEAPVFVAALSGADLVLGWANEPLLQVLGGRRALGRPLAELLDAPAGGELLARLDRVYRTGQRCNHRDVPLPASAKPDSPAQPRWVDLIVQPVREPDGGVSGVLMHAVDATAQHHAAQALRDSEARCHAAQEEAAQAGRLKDEFLRMLSHEMRTPLAAIAGWAHLLERDGLSERDRKAGIAAIARNAQVQAQLIADLLDMRSIESGRLQLHPERLDAAQAVRAALETAAPAAQAKDIQLDSELDAEAGAVLADPQRLQQILGKLVTNAIKFTPRGGRVVLSLRRTGGQVEIVVADNGRGIAPEFLPHVFERFRQQDGSTTRQHGGLGIGLALVRELVELHGGSVRAASAGEDQGTQVQVRLPAAAQPPSSADDAAQPQRELDGVKVLAIDDDPDGRALLRRVLEAAGGEVTVAASALEGLELLRRQRPQVVLADIGMPGHDGYEFVSWLRRLHPDAGGRTPAAALTAFDQATDRQRALRAGFQSHLVKPVDARRLVHVVARLARDGGSAAGRLG